MASTGSRVSDVARATRWGSAFALGIVLSGLAFGIARATDDDDDDDNNNKGSKPVTLAEKAASRFPQPVVVGTLIKRTVLQPLESQPILGHVQGLVRKLDNTIDVIVDYGGFFGFGARPIAVPVDAMVLSGQFMEIVDFTPEQLDKFPTYTGGEMPIGPEVVIKVGLAKPSH